MPMWLSILYVDTKSIKKQTVGAYRDAINKYPSLSYYEKALKYILG